MCICDNIQWFSGAEQGTVHRAVNTHLRVSPAVLASLWCQAGDQPWWPLLGWHPPQLSESSRRHVPGNTSVDGFWSLSEYPEIYKLQQLFPLQCKRQRTKKNETYFRDSLRTESTETKLILDPFHTNFKCQKEILMSPSQVFCFICAAESVFTQGSTFLPGSLNLALSCFLS